MLSSYQVRLIAIQKVLQLNEKNKIAGIDKKLTLTIKERFQLEKKLALKAKI